MIIRIIAVGRLRERYWQEAAADYARRIRPYARRTAGTPVKFEVSRSDSASISVYMEWDHDPAKGETRIFLPREALFGAGGYAVTTTGDSLEYSYDNEELYLICESAVAGRKSITIRSGN